METKNKQKNPQSGYYGHTDENGQQQSTTEKKKKNTQSQPPVDYQHLNELYGHATGVDQYGHLYG
uniref:Uncharacterized protein n=1 Tax=Meloidogyne enterolobii TaxID=390850 RepID=A0A6V7XHD3_MELEN|nr:unnamed protein product [Meloidogyne enterolobii]